MSDVMPMLYFGKLRSRGDFVRSAAHPALIHSLDRWLSSGIELMAEDAHWKPIYDQADGSHFAMISPLRHTAVVGHLLPSADLSGRRFPFLTGVAVEAATGPDLLALGPLIFQSTWMRLAEAAERAVHIDEEGIPAELAAMAQTQLPLLCPAVDVRQNYDHFLARTTLATLARDISGQDAVVDVRQMLLAIGLLLQPVMASSSQPIEKGLCLPLPQDEALRFAVATFWMDLIAQFLSRSRYDLTLFLPRGINHPPCLLVSFSAGAANVLHGIFDSRVTGNIFITLHQSPWVEDYVENDYALKKLSSYLLTPDMALAQVLSSFQEAFLGS